MNQKKMDAKSTKCGHCGSKDGECVGLECGTWGRPVIRCSECRANGK